MSHRDLNIKFSKVVLGQKSLAICIFYSTFDDNDPSLIFYDKGKIKMIIQD